MWKCGKQASPPDACMGTRIQQTVQNNSHPPPKMPLGMRLLPIVYSCRLNSCVMGNNLHHLARPNQSSVSQICGSVFQLPGGGGGINCVGGEVCTLRTSVWGRDYSARLSVLVKGSFFLETLDG